MEKCTRWFSTSASPRSGQKYRVWHFVDPRGDWDPIETSQSTQTKLDKKAVLLKTIGEFNQTISRVMKEKRQVRLGEMTFVTYVPCQNWGGKPAASE
jgi:hypothetical protein